MADLIEKPVLKGLWELVQILLTLSHDHVAVERGFSIATLDCSLWLHLQHNNCNLYVC